MYLYREFLTPDDEEVYDTFGEWPDSDENGTRILTFQDTSGQSLVFSYHVLERSVRVRWMNNEEVTLVDIYRECATRLSFSPGKSTRNILIEFDMGECAGVMDIQIAPHFAIEDRLLFR